MSETEAFKGRLKEFVREPDETLLHYVIRFIKAKGKENEIPQYMQHEDTENARNIFFDVFYKESGVLINDVIFEIVTMRSFEYDDMFEASRNSDGTIDFTVKYYNGGCSFSEALERAFSKMNKK